MDSSDSEEKDVDGLTCVTSFPSKQEVVDLWNTKVLEYSHIKDYWRLYVPRVICVDKNRTSPEWSFNGNLIQDVLFGPLEGYICNGNPDEIFQNLQNKDDPPSICGKVFKMSEPTYNCRECGTDPTCVLCVDCFTNSEHRNHKYKMSTSSGGGCCDCGDTEAWKKSPHCNVHIVGTKSKSDSDYKLLKPLSKEMSERAAIIFRAVLKYSCYLLTYEHAPDLPSDLKLNDTDDPLNFTSTPDTYCTILYNDETHTFEHVISTLSKVLKCNHKEAVEYVTNIDRIGRTVVRCSSFTECKDLKEEIVRITSRSNVSRPLKVIVAHAHVIAHQIFAIKLLTWLQKILTYSKGFREIFTNVVSEKSGAESPIINRIMSTDSFLWKAARIHWHRLFITGMMMEYENKKTFARIFTEHYGSIMKEFILDDHDRSVSIASMGVQLYTVPSIAHYLISTQAVLFILLNTFVSECNPNLKEGHLEFQRNEQNIQFKRAQYILYDLQYLLSSIPDTWTAELRNGFSEGIYLFLKLFNYMQGMDAATRQLGQHMEYEPEWETAFNLHMKLSPVITALIKWCGTDKLVLIKTYRQVLKKLQENPCSGANVPGEVRELADHSASCILYDVGTQPVSVHLPLSRFLAGLHLHIEKYNLSFNSSEFALQIKPTLEELIEPVLRTQVMISQVHAGLWRRNGYSILHQIYFYHNVKCRSEMLDQDIVLLQIGASLIESNEFLIHLLNKFKLIHWADFDFEEQIFKKSEDDSTRHTISLVEEFLMLLIVIIGERYKEGVGKVTEEDCIKKEIIQQLCVKPLSHSELNKELPESHHRETGIERVINDVATFKKPNYASGKGVYKLKSEFYDQYNVFYYHYTKEELSKSEEAQRKRRKALGLLECCPPPPLPSLLDSFKMLSNLLQCDVMLHIMKVVLTRAVDLRARSFSEYQLQRVLHLIGYALHEEERQDCDFFRFTERCEKWELIPLLEGLTSSQRVEAHTDLIKWTLNKFKQVQTLVTSRNNSDPIETDMVENVDKMEVDESPEKVAVVNELEKQRKAKLAAERRAKVMAQMSVMQNSFMKENEKLFDQTAVNTLTDEEEPMALESNEKSNNPVALGELQTVIPTVKLVHVCILCQEKQEIKIDQPAMVYGAFVQKSSVLRAPKDNSLGEADWTDLYYLPARFGVTQFASSCGHVMHSHCWKKYFSNVMAKENRRPYRFRQPTSYDVEKKEFLCPLCESLCNTVIPVIPPLNTLHPPKKIFAENLHFEGWLKSVVLISEQKNYFGKRPGSKSQNAKKRSNKNQDEEETTEIESTSENTVSAATTSSEADMDTSNETPFEAEPGFLVRRPRRRGRERDTNDTIFIRETDVELQIVLYSNPSDDDDVNRDVPIDCPISESLLEMITSFTKNNFGKQSGAVTCDEASALICCWKCCAYTIHIVERILRSNSNKSILGDLTSRQRDCIEALIKVSAIQEYCKKERLVNGCAITVLGVLFDRSPKLNSCVLDWDPFGMLVLLTMSLPTLYTESPVILPTGTVLDLYILKLCFIASIAQIIVGCKFPSKIFDMESEKEIPSDIDREDTLLLGTVWLLLYGNKEYVNTYLLWEEIKKHLKPFLRCCVIFYHFVTGVPPPECLTNANGDTYSNMCNYLGLPDSCKVFLNNINTMYLFELWHKHPKIMSAVSKSEKHFQSYLPVRHLIELPEDYSELINSVSNFSCPNSNIEQEDSRNPTLCLVCGEMLCSQSYCCQVGLNNTSVGACAYHTYSCCATGGIFLRVRECEILLLSFPNRGCFLPPPYIDEYGETDQGLHRGNPLKLCKDRYQKLNNMWLNHSIHEEVSHFIEGTNAMTVTQWHHL